MFKSFSEDCTLDKAEDIEVSDITFDFSGLKKII